MKVFQHKNLLLLTTALVMLPLCVKAADVNVSNWQGLNDELRRGNNAIVTNAMTQWEYGPIALDLSKGWSGIKSSEGNKFVLSGGAENPNRFLIWNDTNPNGGHVTLNLENVVFQNFINKNVDGDYATGAVLDIYSNSTENNLNIKNVNFLNNKVEISAENKSALGGAIRNDVVYGQNLLIENALFDGNSAVNNNTSSNSYAKGGALYLNFSQYVNNNATNNTYKISNTIFQNNSAAGSSAYGGAVYINAENFDENLPAISFENVTFENNSASGSNAYGGAVSNGGSISLITGDFVNNYTSCSDTTYGGAVYNYGMITAVTGDFTGNYASGFYAIGGAVFNGGMITAVTGDFTGNYASGFYAMGGAVYNENGTITALSGDFVGNYSSGSSLALGGAVMNAGTITFIADADNPDYEDDILFQGNYVTTDGGKTKENEAIFNMTTDGVGGVLNFTTQKGGSYTFYDDINGGAVTFNEDNKIFYDPDSPNQSIVNFDGDGTGRLNLFADIKGQNEVNFNAAYLINMQDGALHQISANKVNINSALNMLVDADLAAKKMDRFENAEIADGGSILISGIKILSDGTEELTQIDFADENYKDKVDTSVTEVLSTKYEYAVKYNEETGQFEFVQTRKLQPEDSAVNRGSTIANAGAVMLTEAVSQKILGADSIKSQGASSGDTFGLKAWVQTFGSRDDVELKHLSPTIDAKFYGVLGGIDSKTFAYDNGVKATYGVYGAYTRSEQKYSGNKIKQKGGYFGLKALFEKGGLFSKLTANMGFLNNEALTKWGKDKFDTKVISAATQTGYDFKLPVTKIKMNDQTDETLYEMNTNVTITPSLYVGYMGIDTDDYTSQAGTAIKNKFMNVVEIAPELKVSNDFGNGFEGYLKGAYKMFIYDNDQVKVDTALLPSMSVKPYVEYGFGFEKTFSTAKAYGDIMRHDGGKRGWDFNLGVKLEF